MKEQQTERSGSLDFSQLKEELRALKAQVERGEITEDKARIRLKDLMIQDDQGRWWTLGYETERWYVREGESWVEREPPTFTDEPRTPVAIGADLSGALAERVWLPVLLTAAGWGVGWATARDFRWGAGDWQIVFAITGFLGGLATAGVLRWVEGSLKSGHAVTVALGWGIAFFIAGPRFSPWLIESEFHGHDYAYGYVFPVEGWFPGGLLTALVLRWAGGRRTPWVSVIVITLGWALVTVLPHSLRELMDVFGIGPTLLAAVCGATGSAVMFWELRRVRQKARGAAAR